MMITQLIPLHLMMRMMVMVSRAQNKDFFNCSFRKCILGVSFIAEELFTFVWWQLKVLYLEK